MANDNLQENLNYSFLLHPDAKDLFAELDYALKNGQHIQKQTKPDGIFNFIRHEFNSFKEYYKEYFELYLSTEGLDDEQYYFIDFRRDPNGNFSRGKIPLGNREYLKDSYIIIGFLLIRIYILELNPEIKHSITGFKNRILHDYEEYKTSLLRLFAKSNDINNTDYEEDSIDNPIENALKKFNELGWILLDKNSDIFEILPSCKRLLKIYEENIRDIDNIIKQNTTKG
ncbi:MAG: hypothetical protein CVU05_02010 [Bacteroidetes bacterium HGW-Bacteroidetes-21]|jgi:hypothetical protein|nr:MAG: hypothetical protein CVU05_02010 [Bacteroidetes bacterium HGW-Bacteroidetes-21]